MTTRPPSMIALSLSSVAGLILLATMLLALSPAAAAETIEELRMQLEQMEERQQAERDEMKRRMAQIEGRVPAPPEAPKPKLRVFLHHQVISRADENKTGGHPHAWKSFDLDMEKGEARFTLDLCEFGVAMYSEENCGFNLVVMIDDAGLNDPDKKGATALVPRAGKLVKMTPLEVSCHASSPCFEKLVHDASPGSSR